MKNYTPIISISFLLLIILGLSSCSKTLYYVYDEDGTREGYPEGYCCFEVKKKEIIYRGYSEEYKNGKAYEDKTYLPPVFIYIMGENLNFDKYALAFGPDELQVKYIKHLPPSEEDDIDCALSVRNNDDNTISIINTPFDGHSIYYYSTENPDSIMSKDQQAIEFCRYGSINWFPPYLKKAKKIDYSQFEKRADLKINYKNPIKTVGDWGEPTMHVHNTPQFIKSKRITEQYTAFEKWIRSQIEFSEQIKQDGLNGWINVNIIIEKDGRVTHDGAMYPSDKNLAEINKQIETIIKKSPKWKPAKINKQRVRYPIHLHIKFDILPANNTDI